MTAWASLRCTEDACGDEVSSTVSETISGWLVARVRLRRLARRAGWLYVYADRSDWCPRHLPPQWRGERDLDV